MIKNVKLAELNISIATVFLEYINFKDDLIEYKYLCCNKTNQQKFDEKLKEKFFNINKFSNHDINKFLLLLRKDVTSLPEKEDFYSYLNMGDITDEDYAHTKRVLKDFEIKVFGECHNLYIQSDTLLLAAVFENFGNIS